jgi:hypothetical protein
MAVLQAKIDGAAHDEIVDGFHGRGPALVECHIEGIVPGHSRAVKTSKATQAVSVGDPFAQFAIVPVLHPPEDQGPEGLRGGRPPASGLGVFQASFEILADSREDLWLIVQEFGDLLEPGIESDALANELEICEADSGIGGSAHLRTSRRMYPKASYSYRTSSASANCAMMQLQNSGQGSWKICPLFTK